MAEIIQVKYTASDGTEWPFQMEKLIRIKTANFHNWTYKADTMTRRFGVRVLRFGKDPAAYKTKIYFGGNIEDRKQRTDDFHTKIERDIRANAPGKLTWGDYWINCFIRASSTYPTEEDGYTANDVEVFCPYPFWIKPQAYNFFKYEGGDIPAEFLDYIYDYDYDYTPTPASSQTIMNRGVGDADFRITFFGPVINPFVLIGDTRYMVNITLAEGEYLVIDSMRKTIIRHTIDGLEVNEFDRRAKGETSIFTPIAVGTTRVTWPMTFDMEIMLYQERSEPAWS